MSEELEAENYHSKDRIKQKEDAILLMWKDLLELLERHKHSLQQASLLMTMLREAETILDTIKELMVSVIRMFREQNLSFIRANDKYL